MKIRKGGPGDAPVMMAMLDGAVAWLASNGRTGQWGSEPWSADPRRVERIAGIARDDEIWAAEVDGSPAGVMAVSPGPPHYVDPIGEPELYITLLVTDRAFAGHGVGAALISKAKDEARAKGAACCASTATAAATGGSSSTTGATASSRSGTSPWATGRESCCPSVSGASPSPPCKTGRRDAAW